MKKIILKNIKGIVWILIGIIFDFIIQLLGMIVPLIISNSYKIDINSWPIIGVEILTIMILLFIFIYILIKFGIKPINNNFKFYKFEKNKFKYVIYGYLTVLGINYILNILQVLTKGSIKIAQNQQTLDTMSSRGPMQLIFVIVLALIVAPLLEETIFRGIVMNYFFVKSNWWINIVLSGVLFGYFHIYQYSGFNVFAFAQYTSMGLILAYVYKKTDKIQYSMSLHFLNNFIAMFSLISMLQK